MFVTVDGVIVKLGDLGGARYTTSGGVLRRAEVGSPHYTAPEVPSGDFTGKADVYSAGLVIAELALQHFQSPGSVLVPNPREMEPRTVITLAVEKLHRVSPGLARLLSDCCTPDPKDRLNSSEALVCLKVQAVPLCSFYIASVSFSCLQGIATASTAALGPREVRAFI